MLKLVTLHVIALLASISSLAQKTTPLILGETLSIYSTILEEDRELNVFLPQSFSPDSSKTYPVIYLLDGSLDEDFIHIAGLTQFMSFSWIDLMPESIVVGIANVDRKRDFTYPTRDSIDLEYVPTGGSSAAFIEYLRTEVKSLIAEKYPINESSTLVGQSLGGLLATEVLYTKSDAFDNYLIVSPSLWWDKESLFSRKLPNLSESTQVFVAVGAEGPLMERVARTLHVKLMPQQEFGARIGFTYLPEKTHGDVLHEAATQGFTFLFEQPKKTKD